MPRTTLAAAAVAELFAPNSGTAWLALLTLSGPGFTTFRVVNNYVDVVSRGNTFKFFPFKLEPPSEISDQLPKAKLSISNVSRELVAAVRSVKKSITATLEIVRAATPNVVEMGSFDFDVLNRGGNALTLEFSLGFEPVQYEPYPAGTMRQLFPGAV